VQFLRRYILPKKCSYWRKKNLFSLASPRFHTVCKKLDYSVNNPKKCRWEENKFSHFETHWSAVKSLSVVFNHSKWQRNKLNFYKHLGVEKRNAYFWRFGKRISFLCTQQKVRKNGSNEWIYKSQSSQYWKCLGSSKWNLMALWIKRHDCLEMITKRPIVSEWKCISLEDSTDDCVR